MKKIFNSAFNAVKNHNKIYSLGILWFLWLIYIVGYFEGSDMALITFFIGFCLTLLGGAYITDNPNKKEKEFLEKLVNYLKEND